MFIRTHLRMLLPKRIWSAIQRTAILGVVLPVGFWRGVVLHAMACEADCPDTLDAQADALLQKIGKLVGEPQASEQPLEEEMPEPTEFSETIDEKQQQKSIEALGSMQAYIREQNYKSRVELPYLTEEASTTVSTQGTIIVDEAGYIIPAESHSFEVASEEPIYCSLIARKNLAYITGLPVAPGFHPGTTMVDQGDALPLLLQSDQIWLIDRTLSVKDELTKLVEGADAGSVLLDAYIFTPDKEQPVEYSKSWLMQAHRIVLYTDKDGRRRVLDPLRGEMRTRSQALSSYLGSALADNSLLLVKPGIYTVDKGLYQIDVSTDTEEGLIETPPPAYDGEVVQVTREGTRREVVLPEDDSLLEEVEDDIQLQQLMEHIRVTYNEPV